MAGLAEDRGSLNGRRLISVDYDPFAASQAQWPPRLIPVDHDPFARDAPAVNAAPRVGSSDLPPGFVLDKPAQATGRIIDFEGNQHEFPADFTDDEISAALDKYSPIPKSEPAGSQLPPGFVLDEPAPSGALPPGFVLDATPPARGARDPASSNELKVIPQPASYVPTGGARGAMVGAQGTGRGLADIAGFIPDVASMGANALLYGADAISQKVGGPAIDYRFPMASEEIAKTAGRVSKAAGVPLVTPETLPEKAAYNVSRYGTQALTGAGILAMLAKSRAVTIAAPDAAPKLADEFLRPYFDAPKRAILGDTVAGGGAGAAVTGTQEIPDSVRDMGHGAVGATADLMAMLAGGAGAATAYELAHRAPSSIFDMLKGGMRAKEVPYDPEFGTSFKNKEVDLAAKHWQGIASDPQAAAVNIEREVAERTAAGTPIPTSGLISGDRGLEMLDKGHRTASSTGSILRDAAPAVKQRFSFGERDTALRDQAVADVNALRPEGGNPADFPVRAQARADAERAVAQREVDRARGGIRAIEEARVGPANELASYEGQGVGASRNIHEMYDATRTAEQGASRQLYNDPAIVNAEVPVNPMRQVADDVLANGTDRNPVPPNVAAIANRFATPNVEGLDPEAAAAAMAHANRPMTMREVNDVRADLDAGITAAVADGDGRTATFLRNMREATGRYQDMLVEQGGPAGEAMAAARTNFTERVAPNFREGTGGEVNKQMRRDANLRPSETADTFLSRPEDAADLMRIARLGGNEAAVTANARTWVMDKLAQRGIARDGEIDPAKLASWRNRNQETLDQIPGLSAEINDMVRQARRGQTIAADRGDALLTAQRGQTEAERRISQGPLGAVAGKDAPSAVATVFGSGNPERSMRELMRTVGANPQGRLDMQAAVAEHFAKKVSGVAPANVSEGTQNVNFAQLVKEFNKHERALAAVYSPAEMNTLRQAQAQLEPLTKRAGQATVGSITAEGKGIADLLEPGIRLMHGALQGGAEVKKIRILERLISSSTVPQANRLSALAMFDPEIAKVLLTRDVKEMQTPLWNKKLQKVIRRVETAKEIGGSDDE